MIVATASAGHLGYAGYGGYAGHGAHVGYAPNPAAHIPSGSVAAGPNGAVVAGPAGSIKTDNGLSGHGAGSVVSGPAGEIATRGGHTVLTGPGNDHDDGLGHGTVYAAAPAVPVAAAPAYFGGHAVPGVGAWGPAAGYLAGGFAHGGALGLIGHGAHGGHGIFGHGW